MTNASVRVSMIAVVVTSLLSTAVRAEGVLGTAMKSHYRLRSVSCYSCHVKGEDKSVLNDFGKTVLELIADKKVSERLAAVKDAEKEEKDRVKDAIEKEFLEALKKFETMKTPGGKTYAEAIKAGEIEGIKPRS